MIFILGGRGLLGSAFVRTCELRKLPFTIIDRANYASHIGARCSLLVNANGNSRKPLAKQDPLAEFDASVRSVRASLIDFRFDRYLHLSSCDVYPDCTSPATTQESQVPDLARQSPYGFHKYLAEQCIQHSAADWLIFRCGGFVGPGLKKNAIFDILKGGPLWLDPASELQFMHTDEAAGIALGLSESGVSGQVLNLCGRGVVRLSDVVNAVGRPVSVQPDSPLVRYDVSIEKISRLIEIPSSRETVLSFVKM